MPDLEFLDEYTGQSLDELLAMEQAYRVDSLVFAMAFALSHKLWQCGAAALSPAERIILVVQCLEREVNNGGYDQFFFNPSREYARDIEAALRAIGCPINADIARRAVEALQIEGEPTADAVETALVAGGDELSELLASLDTEYYAFLEPIADRLFAFAKANRATICLSPKSAG